MALDSIELKLVIPTAWNHLGGSNETVAEQFEVLRAHTYGTGNIPLFAYNFFQIAKVMRKFQPDIIDIHEEPYSVSCFELVCLAKMFVPKAACVFYSAQNIKKSYPPPFCWMEQFVYRTCKGSYPCSEGVKEVLTAKGFNRNVITIPLGVDTEFFSDSPTERTKLGLHAPFVVGYFGRLEEYKGIDFLIKALGQISDNHSWQLLVVGKGEFEQSLKKLALNMGIDRNIVWSGGVPMEQVPAHLNACDVVVIPSCTTPTWKEQFGRVAAEAMACAVPVIASDSGSLPEVIGDAGIIVPEQNAEAIAAAITQLINDTGYGKQLGRLGKERVATLYTWKRVAQMTLELYERALADRRT